MNGAQRYTSNITLFCNKGDLTPASSFLLFAADLSEMMIGRNTEILPQCTDLTMKLSAQRAGVGWQI